MTKAYIFSKDIAFLGRFYYGARICEDYTSSGVILPSVDYLKYGITWMEPLPSTCRCINIREKSHRKKRMILLSDNGDLIADLSNLYSSYGYKALVTINTYNHNYRKYALELRIPSDYVLIVEEILRLERIPSELGGNNPRFNYYIFEDSIEDSYSHE